MDVAGASRKKGRQLVCVEFRSLMHAICPADSCLWRSQAKRRWLRDNKEGGGKVKDVVPKI